METQIPQCEPNHRQAVTSRELPAPIHLCYTTLAQNKRLVRPTAETCKLAVCVRLRFWRSDFRLVKLPFLNKKVFTLNPRNVTLHCFFIAMKGAVVRPRVCDSPRRASGLPNGEASPEERRAFWAIFAQNAVFPRLKPGACPDLSGAKRGKSRLGGTQNSLRKGLSMSCPRQVGAGSRL
jgi:hypothetical protein